MLFEKIEKATMIKPHRRFGLKLWDKNKLQEMVGRG